MYLYEIFYSIYGGYHLLIHTAIYSRKLLAVYLFSKLLTHVCQLTHIAPRKTINSNTYTKYFRCFERILVNVYDKFTKYICDFVHNAIMYEPVAYYMKDENIILVY